MSCDNNKNSFFFYLNQNKIIELLFSTDAQHFNYFQLCFMRDRQYR